MAQFNQDPGSWRSQAPCNDEGVDPAIFFPRRGQSSAPAKAICAQCDFRIECLESGLEQHPTFGIWGGLNENERRALTRQRKVGRSLTGMTVEHADLGEF